MKKGAVPELSYKWWSKNKDITMPKTGLGDALKAYEMAKDRSSPDYEEMLKKLAVVRTKAKAAQSMGNKLLHKDTLDALKRYAAVIENEEDWINTNYKAYKKRFAAEVSGEIPMQKMGGPVVIWKRDVGDDVEKAAKLDNIKVVMDVRVELRLNDDILDVMEDAGDKASAALMAAEAKKAGKALVATIVDKLVETDKDCGKVQGSAVDKLLQEAKKEIERIIADEQKKIAAIPGEVWAEFVKRKKQYKDYKLKAATDVTIQVLMVTSDAIATGAAAAGTFGAAGVVGVVILVRDCAKLARQVYDLALKAEKVQKDLAKDIETLEDAYRSTVRRVGQEATGTLIKAALSTDSPFMATLPKCNDKIKLLDNKVAGLETAGREFSSLLTEALDKAGKLERELDSLPDKKARKTYEKLVATRKELDQALKDCTKMMKRVRDTKPGIEGLQKSLDALNGDNPKFLKIFDVALPAVTGVALAGASGGLGFAGAATGLDHANTAVTLAAVMGNEAKGFLEQL